tara:strand:- start:153 stop:389 length:237 start_codon:yes stop_codon:yes gene_type:complete
MLYVCIVKSILWYSLTQQNAERVVSDTPSGTASAAAARAGPDVDLFDLYKAVQIIRQVEPEGAHLREARRSRRHAVQV